MSTKYQDGFITQAFLPFGALREEYLRATLLVLDGLEFFKPQFVGIDERKRVRFDVDETIAMTRALASSPPLGNRPLYIWHRACDADPSSLYLKDAAPSTLRMVFVGADATEHGQQLMSELGRLVEALRPSLATISMRTNMAEKIPDRPDLLEYIQANPAPTTAREIYYAGLGRLSTATWLDGEIAENLGPQVLQELGGRRSADGRWYIEVKEEPWTASALETAEFWKRTSEVLRRHGLLARSMNPMAGPLFPAPNWTRPASWTAAADPRMERKIAGPNV